MKEHCLCSCCCNIRYAFCLGSYSTHGTRNIGTLKDYLLIYSLALWHAFLQCHLVRFSHKDGVESYADKQKQWTTIIPMPKYRTVYQKQWIAVC